MERDLRSVFRVLVSGLNTLGALAAAVVALVWRVAPETVGPEWGRAAFLPAIVLLAANLLRFLYLRAPRREPDYILSRGRMGDVRVAKEALESSLRAAGEKLREVVRLRIAVAREAPRRILVRIFYTAAEGVPLLEVSERLRDLVRQRFGEMVTLEPGLQVAFELDFEGYSGKAPRKAEEAKPAPAPAQAEAPPFTGPRYPIDDGEEV